MERALTALFQTTTRAEAARAAGLSERTLRTYFRNVEFVQAYSATLGAVLQDAGRRSAGALDTALSTLEEITENTLDNSATRTAAARVLVDTALKLHTLTALEQRLAALEQRMTEGNDNGDD